jgi:hypothetical protein
VGKKKGKVFPAHAVKAHRGNRSIAPLILIFSPRWKSVVNFKPQPLYTWERTTGLIEYRTGWAPDLVCPFWRREKFLGSILKYCFCKLCSFIRKQENS